MAEELLDWRDRRLVVRRSRGPSKVPYVEDWTRNVIGVERDENAPDFLRRQVRAYVARRSWFTEEDAAVLSAGLGRISKFQSLRSEDALTWSWFGTLSGARPEHRQAALQWLCDQLQLDVSVSNDVAVRQWMRVPHPNVPGRVGPEVDAVVDDPDGVLMYVEAKWDAILGTGRGATAKSRDDQVVLRRLALRAEASANPGERLRAVVGVSRLAHDLGIYEEHVVPTFPVEVRWITWERLAQCQAHPLAEQFRKYVSWKKAVAG